jgi:hypothetical protein
MFTQTGGMPELLSLLSLPTQQLLDASHLFYTYYGTLAEITLKGSEYYNDLMKRTDTEPIQTSIYNKKKSGKI